VEVLIQVSGFNPIFSNVVMRRSSYTYKEIIWGAKFKPMYHESEDGMTTILELNKLNHYEPVDL
jgi:inward rectifier potassium channel